jgi:hypothetical protein
MKYQDGIAWSQVVLLQDRRDPRSGMFQLTERHRSVPSSAIVD